MALSAPFPVKSLEVDIENVFRLEQAVASILDHNKTVDDVVIVNFTEFRGILNQSDGASINLAEVVRREDIQYLKPFSGALEAFFG